MTPEDDPLHPLGIDARLRLYFFMRLARECDDEILRLYRLGRIVGGAYAGTGNEATAVGSAYVLRPYDYLFPLHRDLGAHLVKGQTLENIFLQQLGKGDSLTRGRDGTGHYADPQKRIFGNVSHLAAMIPVAAGVALASKLRKEPSVVLTYIGDGGSNVGDFHEGMNMAAVMKLPLVLVIENNQFAYSTPNSRQFAAAKLSDRAAGYGMPGVTIDGTDVLAVYEVCRQAVDRARLGEGPTIIESVTMRMRGHSASDDASYVPASMLEEWKRKDPLAVFERHLEEVGELPPEKKGRIGDEIKKSIDHAVSTAMENGDPHAEEAGLWVYADDGPGGPLTMPPKTQG